MNLEQKELKAKKYSAVKTKIFAADLFLSLSYLVIFQLFFSKNLSRIVFNISNNFYVACFIFVGIFIALMHLVSLPLHFFGSFTVEHRFDLSNQSFFAWIKDDVKSFSLSFFISIGCIEVFYLVLRNFPHSWWLVTSGLWILFTVVLARILPVLLIPIFYKYMPIRSEDLKSRIIALSEKAKIKLFDVCEIDFSKNTKKANAALVGLGGSRKVIIADTLANEFTPNEVGSVVAHEFGHFKYKHLWQLLIFSAVFTMGGFFVLSIMANRIVEATGSKALWDLYLFPALIFLLTVSGLAIMPLQNFFSRVLERQADRFALEITKQPETFVSVMRKLADMNLAEADPPLWKKIFFYDHPPIGERIRMGEEALRASEKD